MKRKINYDYTIKGTKPVSYTHLDVYKRQGLDYLCPDVMRDCHIAAGKQKGPSEGQSNALKSVSTNPDSDSARSRSGPLRDQPSQVCCFCWG